LRAGLCCLPAASNRSNDPSMEGRFAALPAPQNAAQADKVKAGVAPYQGGEFGPAIGPCPAVTPKAHLIVEREVVDREGEGRVHGSGQK
jgi:hypothetical protein